MKDKALSDEIAEHWLKVDSIFCDGITKQSIDKMPGPASNHDKK